MPFHTSEYECQTVYVVFCCGNWMMFDFIFNLSQWKSLMDNKYN